MILGTQRWEGFPNDSKGCRVENQFPYRQRQPCNHPVVQAGRILPSSILQMKEPWLGDKQRPAPSRGQRPGLRPPASPSSPSSQRQFPKGGAGGGRSAGRRALQPWGRGWRGDKRVFAARRSPGLGPPFRPGPRVRRTRARPRGSAHEADAGQTAAQTLARPSPARPVPLTHYPRPAAGAEGGAGPRQGPAVHRAAPARAEVRRGLWPRVAALGRAGGPRSVMLGPAWPGRVGGLRTGCRRSLGPQWVPVCPRSSARFSG